MKVTPAELSRVIALIHEAGAAPERWPDALSAVMGLMEGSRIALMDVEAGSDRLLGISHLGHDPAHARMYADYYYSIDPTLERALSMPPLKAATNYEEFPRLFRERHEYFDWATRVCNIGDVIGVSTNRVESQRCIMSLQRTPDGRAYDGDEKALVELLAPHIELAKRVQLRLRGAMSAASELEAAFARLAVATFVVDPQGCIRHGNDATSTLFARYRQVTSRHGKLTFRDAKVHAAFQDALRKAVCGFPRSSALPLPLGARRTGEILLSPLSAAHSAASAWPSPMALVVIATGERDEETIAWRMHQLYGLSPAESRLAASLAVGLTVGEIAVASRVSEATVRTQLRSVFAKTGTSRQAEIVGLALMGSVVLRDR